MELPDHLNVIKEGGYMKKLTVIESKEITGGGISLSGAILSSLKGCICVVFEIGQTVGGAIRRISSGRLCSF